MESGDAPLDSLVSHYQKGMNLLKHCREKIKSAELKIQEVTSVDSPEIDS
ncbi:MAG: exodeoxyribonuclease VII small subunit [Verrucomicrobia bacterium TMED40]|nr:MAG: exodeoxyribonuclease VII small subunit [Verrucomicrobia bacterium TMED40]